MSNVLAALQAQAALAAQTGPDMTEVVKGGSGSRLLPEGNAFLQLVEYVEYGSQPQEYQGVAKDPAPCFQLGFAITGQAPDPANPGQFIPYTNPDGTPYLLRTYTMAMSRNEKAKAFLLFKAMNWKNTATHFAQLLGQKFIAKIVTHTPKGGKPRSQIDLKTVLPPLDLMSGQPYPIADAPDDYYRLFLWDHPTLEAWKALHIEGEWEAKDGQPARSKNFVQEEILGAVDFPGSPLEQLLLTSGVPFTRPAPKPKAAAPAAPAMAAPAAAPAAPMAVPAAAPAMPSTPAMPASAPVAAPAPVSAPAAVATPAVPTPSATVAAPVPSAAPAANDPPFSGGTPVAAPVVPAMPAMPAMPTAA